MQVTTFTKHEQNDINVRVVVYIEMIVNKKYKKLVLPRHSNWYEKKGKSLRS